MAPLAIAYVSGLVIFVVVDLAWLSFIAPRFYRPIMGDIMLTDVNLKAAAVFYLAYPLGLVYFAIAPALKSGTLQEAAIKGALLGLFAYGTYDLTNQATLRNWTTALTAADMAWGAIVSGIAAVSAAWIVTKFA